MAAARVDSVLGVSVGILATVALGVVAGALVGSAGLTAHTARATSYLSDDPKACINCHIMNEQHNSWLSGPHHARASCNDCHVPHDSLAHKYLVKAEQGFRHSKGFTLNNFHEPIRITPSGREVVIANCVRCHEAMTHDIRAAVAHGPGGPAVDCLHCHSSMGHGPMR